MNRLLVVWETLLSFSKYFLSNTFSQNIGNCFHFCSVYIALELFSGVIFLKLIDKPIK